MWIDFQTVFSLPNCPMKIADRPLTPECLVGFLGKKTCLIEEFIIKGEGLGSFCGKQCPNLLVLEAPSVFLSSN